MGALVRALSLTDTPRQEVKMANREDHTQAMDSITATVCAYYGVKRIAVLGASRTAKLVPPRQVAMWMCRDMLMASYPQIGEYFRRDHSTVRSACQAVQGWIDGQDPETLHAIARIRSRLLNPTGVQSAIEKAVSVWLTGLSPRVRKLLSVHDKHALASLISEQIKLPSTSLQELVAGNTDNTQTG